MLIVDDTGVPAIVQRVNYNYQYAWLEVTYFDGKQRVFETDDLGIEMSLSDKNITHEQVARAMPLLTFLWEDQKFEEFSRMRNRGFEAFLASLGIIAGSNDGRV